MTKRKGIKKPRGVAVELELGVNTAVDEQCRKLLVVKVAYVNNAMRWLAACPQFVQRAIVGGMDVETAPAYATALRKLADDLESGRAAIISSEMGSAPPKRVP